MIGDSEAIAKGKRELRRAAALADLRSTRAFERGNMVVASLWAERVRSLRSLQRYFNQLEKVQNGQ